MVTPLFSVSVKSPLAFAWGCRYGWSGPSYAPQIVEVDSMLAFAQSRLVEIFHVIKQPRSFFLAGIGLYNVFIMPSFKRWNMMEQNSGQLGQSVRCLDLSRWFLVKTSRESYSKSYSMVRFQMCFWMETPSKKQSLLRPQPGSSTGSSSSSCHLANWLETSQCLSTVCFYHLCINIVQYIHTGTCRMT